VLEAPWACNETYACTQGNGEQPSHTGLARYAWDFGMPVGTDVLAAHGGVVLMIEIDSQLGGCSDVYANDANYVLIDHQDGTAGLYLHVEGHSSNLRVGDPVATGDVIARVGQTGFSCGPHLHVQVQEICGSWWCQSVPAEFSIADPEQISSENCAGSETVVAGPRSDKKANCACSSTADPRKLFGLLALLGLGVSCRCVRVTARRHP
jgi:murein DD-endopeptidase MepM/ murein hydrolase activator NlpD